jgi:hypothetical protein
MAITHKRGDTFEVLVEVALNGQIVDLTGWTIRSQIRDGAKNLLKELDIDPVDLAQGQFLMTATDTETRQWPPASYSCDIEFIDPAGFVISSDTFPVTVLRDVTRDFTP